MRCLSSAEAKTQFAVMFGERLVSQRRELASNTNYRTVPRAMNGERETEHLGGGGGDEQGDRPSGLAIILQPAGRNLMKTLKFVEAVRLNEY